jgi:hypothetical protein
MFFWNGITFINSEELHDYNRRCAAERCLPQDLIEELGPTPLVSYPAFSEFTITDYYYKVWYYFFFVFLK